MSKIKGPIKNQMNQIMDDNMKVLSNMKTFDSSYVIKQLTDEWVFVAKQTSTIKYENVKRNIKLICFNIIDEYLDNMNIFNIDEDLIRSSSDYAELHHISSKLKVNHARLCKSKKLKDLLIRLESKNSIFTIKYLNDDDNNRNLFLLIEYDLIHKIMIVKFLSLSKNDDGFICNSSWFDAFCVSNSLSNTKNRAKILGANLNNDIFKYMNIMNYAFKMYINDGTDKVKDMKHPHHTRLELDMISKSLNKIEYRDCFLVNLISLGRMNHNDIIEDYNQYNMDRSFINELISHDFNYPLIDITDREEDYISQYCYDNGFRLENENTIDITEFLRSPRYGKVLNFNTDFKSVGDEDKYNITVGYEMDIEKDYLLFLIAYETSDYIIYDSAYFNNITNFNMASSIINIKIRMYMKGDNFPDSMDSIRKEVPNMILNEEAIVSIIWNTIMIHIVTYLKPERTRMVRISERKLNVPGKSNNSKSSDNDEFVVTRILKTAREAKKYVKEMNKSKGIPMNREYVLEEWPRVGHYRRTSTGKQVWIESTTCHRHLPLTEKEIHIKL